MIISIGSIFTWFSTWLSTILNLNIPDGSGGYLKVLAVILFIFQMKLLIKVIKIFIDKQSIGTLNGKE